MTNPTQRRHDEILGRLDALIDAVQPPRLVIPPSNFKFNRDAIQRAMRQTPLTTPDITEEPPVGSQVTDREGDVWERREGGWALWWPERSEWLTDLYGSGLDPWPVVRVQAPLRFTTDEDRRRVGLPVEAATAIWERECKRLTDRANLWRERCQEAEADLARVTEERDEAVKRAEGYDKDRRAVADRYERLRKDVERYEGGMGYVSAHTRVQLLAVKNRLRSILARDDERGQA